MCDCDCGDIGVSVRRRESAYGMTSVDDAVEMVLQQSEPLDAVCVEAREADGFVLAEPVHSTVGEAFFAFYIKQNEISCL